MAITALRLAAQIDYISDKDPAKKEDPTNATVFQIGTLDSRVFGYIQDKTTQFSVDPKAGEDAMAETTVKMHQVNFEMVQFGLRGWTNLKDTEGNDIRFKTHRKNVGGKTYDVVDPLLIEMLPADIITELAEQIKKLNNLSAEQGNA